MTEKLEYILYLDDDPAMRLLVQATLQNSGQIKVGLCETAIDVLENAIDEHPQMIILDVMMSTMDGPAIYEEIKKDVRISNIPVVFLTAKTDPVYLQGLLDMGAAGVITKPFDLVSLHGQLVSLWENSNVRQK